MMKNKDVVDNFINALAHQNVLILGDWNTGKTSLLLSIFPTGAADAVFFCVLHERLPVCHVLCYTLVHERYGLLSPSCGVVTQL